jgi:hypothetical protein
MPPPSLGLDLTSPIDNMDPAAALELINVFPGAGSPSVRLGYQQFADLGTASPIYFMHEYPLKDGTSRLIAANASKVYSVSSVGVVTDISKVGGYLSGNWNKELFAGNIYLANADGDAPQVYTGTGTCANISVGGGGYAITDLINIASYRERLYLVERNSCKMWYHTTAGANLVAGSPVLKSYDFQYVFKRGGYLLFTGAFTNQRGVTTQDLFFAMSSQGEIVFYSGSSPDDSAWTLVAQFVIGKPLGPRAYLRINQDIWVFTEQGVISLGTLFNTSVDEALNAVSRNINPLITQYAAEVGISERWNGFFWAGGRRAYVMLPDSGTACDMLVYSIDTKAWTRFSLYTNAHSTSACKFQELPYYGSSTGIIYKGETGYQDAVVSGTGQSISFSARMAFSFYGSRGNYKAFKDIRPLMRGKRGITLNLGLDTDFKRLPTVTSFSSASGLYTPWGSPWGSSWSSDIDYVYDRYAVAGQGHCAAIRFGGSIKNTPLQLFGFEIRYDVGGQV